MNTTEALLAVLVVFVTHLVCYPLKGYWGGISRMSFTKWLLQGVILSVPTFVSMIIISGVFAGEWSPFSVVALALATALIIIGGRIYRRRHNV